MLGEVGEQRQFEGRHFEDTGELVRRDRIDLPAVRSPGQARQSGQSTTASAPYQPLVPSAADTATVAAQHCADAGRAVGSAALGMDQSDVVE